jgi:hypothetical protein
MSVINTGRATTAGLLPDAMPLAVIGVKRGAGGIARCILPGDQAIQRIVGQALPGGGMAFIVNRRV